MARKPASRFEVVPIEQALPRLEPPSHLSQDEAALFESIVQHLVRCTSSRLMPSYWLPTCKPVS